MKPLFTPIQREAMDDFLYCFANAVHENSSIVIATTLPASYIEAKGESHYRDLVDRIENRSDHSEEIAALLKAAEKLARRRVSREALISYLKEPAPSKYLCLLDRPEHAGDLSGKTVETLATEIGGEIHAALQAGKKSITAFIQGRLSADQASVEAIRASAMKLISEHSAHAAGQAHRG